MLSNEHFYFFCIQYALLNKVKLISHLYVLCRLAVGVIDTRSYRLAMYLVSLLCTFETLQMEILLLTMLSNSECHQNEMRNVEEYLGMRVSRTCQIA